MKLPWTCDALLPDELRAASPLYLRLSGRFDVRRLDYADGCELVAFLHVVPPLAARHLFKWSHYTVGKHVAEVVEHLKDDANVARMAAENVAAWDAPTGWAIIDRLCADGYVVRGRQPPLIRRTILTVPTREARKRLGLEKGQVKTIRNDTSYTAPALRRRAEAAAAREWAELVETGGAGEELLSPLSAHFAI